MYLKTLHRNIIPATPVAVAGTITSAIQQATVGRGIRFYITITGATTGGGTDEIFLCGVPPSLTQGNPAALKAAPVTPIVGLAAPNALSANGVRIADFYPGAWLPVGGIGAGGALIGAIGITLPIFWAVQVVLGAGNASTITIDGEYL